MIFEKYKVQGKLIKEKHTDIARKKVKYTRMIHQLES